MSGITFDFTVNIPVLLAVLGGFFVFGRWLSDIAVALRDIKKINERLDDFEDIVNDHGQKIAALQALSDGYARENFRRIARERD